MPPSLIRPIARLRRPWGLRGYLAFLALALLLHWPLFFGAAADRLRVGPPSGDYQRQFHPYRAFVARAWSGLQPPLWNPHQLAGSPALADPQLAVLYPFRLPQALLALFLDPLPLWALDLELLLHLALGAWGTALLLGRLGAGPPARAFGGLAFGLGGYLTGYPLQQLAILDTAAWLPLLFWALIGWMRPDATRTDLRRLLLIGLMPLLAGHPQTALIGFYGALAWALALGRRSGLGWPGAGRRLAAWLLGTAGLGALQWLPTADFLGRSARRLSDAEIAAGLPLADSLQLLMPGRLSQWSPLYAGILTLPLACWAWRQAPRARFFLGLAAAGWLWSLGGNQPLFPLLRLLPGLDWFRHQERAAFLWSFGLAVAAGLGLDRLQAPLASGGSQVGRLPRRLLGFGAALAALALLILTARPDAAPVPTVDACGPEEAAAPGASAGAAGAMAEPGSPDGAGPIDGDASASGLLRRLARSSATPDGRGWLALLPGLAQGLAFSALIALLAGALLRRGLAPEGLGPAAAWGLVALLAFDLASVNRGRALCPVEAGPGRADPLLAALLPHARDGRVSSEALLPGGPNAASLWGLQDSTGDSPLRLAGLEALVAEAPELVWWRILGVRYLVTRRPPDAAPLRPVARRGDGAEDPALYEVLLPAPPVWLPAEAPCPPAASGAPPPWLDPTYDPIRRLDFAAGQAGAQAVCREPASPGAAAEGPDTAGQDAAAAIAAARAAGPWARLDGLDPGRARMSAYVPVAGWLVWSQAFDPGWRVTARSAAGERLRLSPLPAWNAVMAVPLPAGEWSLRWTYWPDAVNWGGLLSLATAALVWWPRRRPQEPALAPPPDPSVPPPGPRTE